MSQRKVAYGFRWCPFHCCAKASQFSCVLAICYSLSRWISSLVFLEQKNANQIKLPKLSIVILLRMAKCTLANGKPLLNALYTCSLIVIRLTICIDGWNGTFRHVLRIQTIRNTEIESCVFCKPTLETSIDQSNLTSNSTLRNCQCCQFHFQFNELVCGSWIKGREMRQNGSSRMQEWSTQFN